MPPSPSEPDLEAPRTQTLAACTARTREAPLASSFCPRPEVLSQSSPSSAVFSQAATALPSPAPWSLALPLAPLPIAPPHLCVSMVSIVWPPSLRAAV